VRRSTKVLLLVLALVFLFLILRFAPSAAGDGAAPSKPGAAPEPRPDVFAEALAEAGLTKDGLGYRPKTTWSRYPFPPFRMPFFDDLLANPTETYEFTRTLGNLVEDWLTPQRLTTLPGEGKPGALYRLGTFLAFDRRIGGFRGFGFGLLDPKPASGEPLLEACVDVDSDVVLGTAGGGDADRVERLRERARDRLRDSLRPIPHGLHAPLARLVLSLRTALLADGAWGGAPKPTAEERSALWAALPGLVESTPDASRHVPAVTAFARWHDEHGFAYMGLRALEAVQRARSELEPLVAAASRTSFRVRIPSWFGDVVFDAAPEEPDSYSDLFLLVDFSPRARRPGPLACTSPTRALSVALLMREVEHVGSSAAPGEKLDRSADLACGIAGCGILYAAGNGSTTYETRSWGLGAGMFGMGVLVDEGGDDVYRCRSVGQGAGYFGAGLLLDAAGNDRYELLEGDGQGFGGPNGIGILADRSGNDVYYAEPTPAKAGAARADYHSDQKIVGSNAQGAGIGRRGDLTDGHAWAGGLGALIDVDGDDVYEAGNFSQGLGYWFGTGLLYDGGGNDVYRSVYFSHGSGAHFAVGAVVDEGGDDQHLLYDFPKVGLGPKAGAGIGFGWDVVNAFVFDRAGNDRYEAHIISTGCSNIRSNGWLIDEGGDDVYLMDEGALAFGAVDEQPYYVVPDRVSPFAFHLPQLGLLLDGGGKDAYLRRPKAGGEPVADASAGDGKSWGRIAPRGPGGGANVAIGRDVAAGRVGFLDAWPRRVAPPPAPSGAK
jgi:hypothetical protein